MLQKKFKKMTSFVITYIIASQGEVLAVGRGDVTGDNLKAVWAELSTLN
jgi:hypothetical protein